MPLPGVNPAGPIFISHRFGDGMEAAVAIARLLRSSGLPVWLDVDDLPPGDIATRLDEALSGGLSGAVLVVTPDVINSTVILNQELPALLPLAKDPDFTLAILTEVEDPADPNAFDRSAPDRLLDPSKLHDALRAKPGIKQYSRIDLTAADIGREFARRRLTVLRRGREGDALTIDVQSRRRASAYASSADLVFRTLAPSTGTRVPEPDVWEDLGRLLAWLPDALAAADPPELHITGGGHLGIGLLLGAGLPETAGIPIAVQSSDGVFRRVRRQLSLRERLPIVGIRPRRRGGPRGAGGPLAVYVDVAEFPGHPTFAAWLVANRAAFGRSIRLSRTGHLDPGPGSRIATSIASAIRDAAIKANTTEVLLFAHTAWPLAVMLGAALNTLTLRIFEWENASGSPTYVEVATVRPGVGGSPVIEVAR